ncbi:related to Sporulation-regulated protein 3 [Saccharomycodes ludwigii]|uniref:Related to Sporulation-regulated protein 3 n=2 Tax=Saccharomycodes ludwigii TaxID=36035 RepID=A0A376BBJ7_9ASCO|nr:related to Sporulation-regulated protein 3 [Saccharomycodes ludwigii]
MLKKQQERSRLFDKLKITIPENNSLEINDTSMGQETKNSKPIQKKKYQTVTHATDSLPSYEEIISKSTEYKDEQLDNSSQSTVGLVVFAKNDKNQAAPSEKLISGMRQNPEMLNSDLAAVEVGTKANTENSLPKNEDVQESKNVFVVAEPLDSDRLVGIGELPLQKMKLTARNGAYFNLMVVGQSGLGKTTFINTLFGTSILPNIWNQIESLMKTPNVTFNKTTSIVRHTSILEEKDISLKFTVIDTPGFGDCSNNSFSWEPITNYIDEQFRSYMFQEEQPDRSPIEDRRVHCCLYFIQPSNKGLSTLDIESMKEISKRVNLIPIIAKGDGLLPKDLQIFKKTIRSILQAQNIKICEFIQKEKDPGCSLIFKDFPYSIIGSESKTLNEEHKLVYGRKYKWGVSEVENEKHCDFVKLRNVLMKENLVDLVLSTEAYYEKCRTKLLETRILQAKDSLINVSGVKKKDEEVINIGITKKGLSELDFDNLNSNKLDNYKCYYIFDKLYMDELVIEWSPIFIHKQWEAKQKFNEIVLLEEKKFKDWKKALFNRQTGFNIEIENLHKKVKLLQKNCQELEKNINMSRELFNHPHKLAMKNPILAKELSPKLYHN